MSTPPLPDVLIPVGGITQADRADAFKAAAELTRAGHHVEIVALDFDPELEAAVEELRSRRELPDEVSVVSPYGELARAGDVASSARGPDRQGWLTRLVSRARTISSPRGTEADDEWTRTPAVRGGHLTALPEVLRSRSAEAEPAVTEVAVVRWRDGAPARRARLRADGTPYQHDYLRGDGRAYLVEWCDESGAAKGPVHALDPGAGEARRFARRADWEVAALAERARRGAVVLAATPWARTLLAHPALAGCAGVPLDGGSAASAVRGQRTGAIE